MDQRRNFDLIRRLIGGEYSKGESKSKVTKSVKFGGGRWQVNRNFSISMKLLDLILSLRFCSIQTLDSALTVVDG